jgi:hypothetical protein
VSASTLFRRVSLTSAAGIVAFVQLAHAQTPRSGANLQAPDAPPPFMEKRVFLPGEPLPPASGTYGYDDRTGRFKAPAMTPDSYGPQPFEGSLPYLDQNQYLKNVKVEAFYPFIAGTGHTWQTTFEWKGRLYMYHYYRWFYAVFDITDPRQAKFIVRKDFDSAQGLEDFGPFTVKFNKKLNKLLAVQCYETPRYQIIGNKYLHPEDIQKIRERKMLRGFRFYEVTGPMFADWKLLSETALDPYHSAKSQPQEGSGCLDIPVYTGDKYLFLAGAPDDTFVNTEYKTYIYAAAQLAYDVSDPTHPKLLSAWWAPGSRLGEEAQYRLNPRAGNKTSWMGARMPLFIPKPVEQGGKYGYAAMGGFGFFVVDISDPSDMKAVAHLDMPVSVTGTEGDNIDVSKIDSTGMIYYSGYPMTDDCYEPYKDIYAIDVRDPLHPKIVTTLPRPTPPADAPFTDFCQRRSSFGPKRSGYAMNNTGIPSPRYMPYAFYNAGMQIFDVNNPAAPVIAGYFVPKMIGENAEHIRTIPKPVDSILVEWDRNLIWVFTNHGFYVLSTPLLGAPKFSLH